MSFNANIAFDPAMIGPTVIIIRHFCPLEIAVLSGSFRVCIFLASYCHFTTLEWFVAVML